MNTTNKPSSGTMQLAIDALTDVARMLKGYADNYAAMARWNRNDPRVSMTCVEVDIEQNMRGYVLKKIAALAPHECNEKPVQEEDDPAKVAWNSYLGVGASTVQDADPAAGFRLIGYIGGEDDLASIEAGLLTKTCISQVPRGTPVYFATPVPQAAPNPLADKPVQGSVDIPTWQERVASDPKDYSEKTAMLDEIAALRTTLAQRAAVATCKCDPEGKYGLAAMTTPTASTVNEVSNTPPAPAEKEAFFAWFGEHGSKCASYKGAQDAFRAGYAAASPLMQPAPSGWKLVPVEPTSEMVRAAANGKGRSTGKYLESQSIIYSDMLAAAPVAPEQKPCPIANHTGEVIIQYRTEGCSDWYDGWPDTDDGAGPYEIRKICILRV